MQTNKDSGKKPSQLSDEELRMLESTLRVQLEVAKHVRVAKVSGAIGTAMLRGPLGAVTSGFTIVSSQMQRRKLKRRHQDVLREMKARGGLECVVRDASQLSKRAIAISMGTGLACCLLAFSADLLIDRAVVQVVSEVVTGMLDDLAMGTVAGLVAAKLATSSTPSTASEPSQQLKPTRSWSNFASTWKTKWAAKKTESLPPDLFGERELLKRDATPQQVEVHRTNEFGPYGECLVLEFSPPNETAGPTADSSSPQSLFGGTTIVGERDALSDAQWRSLWTLEDGPMDVRDDDTENYDLFGTDVQPTVVEDDYDLFGVSASGESQATTRR